MELTIEQAVDLLDVKLPTTPNALKQAYKRASLKYHPDHNKSQTADQDFIKIKASYDLLLSSGKLEFTADQARDLRTESGVVLSTLGKGLGPTTNGTPCPECDSRGFTAYTEDVEACNNCRMSGHSLFRYGYELRCQKCKGTGKFENGRTKGECFDCKGSGWRNSRSACPHCRGAGVVKKENGRKFYNACGKCKGCGELPMWNPVLPKGLLGSLGKK